MLFISAVSRKLSPQPRAWQVPRSSDRRPKKVLSEERWEKEGSQSRPRFAIP